MTQPPQYPQQPQYGGPAYQQPYPQQQQYPYPQAPYPAPGYGMQPKPPNGATAIIAGILAVIGGVLNLGSLVLNVIGLAVDGYFGVWQIIFMVQALLLAGTLLPGGILLFVRKPAGRMLTMVGSGLAILLAVAGFALSFAHFGQVPTGMLGGQAIGIVLVVLPAAATLTLALVKPTAEWCATARR